MVISPESVGKRSSRLTCSDACRMKVYYDRNVQAQVLARQGLSAPEIARSPDDSRRPRTRFIDG